MDLMSSGRGCKGEESLKKNKKCLGLDILSGSGIFLSRSDGPILMPVDVNHRRPHARKRVFPIIVAALMATSSFASETHHPHHNQDFWQFSRIALDSDKLVFETSADTLKLKTRPVLRPGAREVVVSITWKAIRPKRRNENLSVLLPVQSDVNAISGRNSLLAPTSQRDQNVVVTTNLPLPLIRPKRRPLSQVADVAIINAMALAAPTSGSANDVAIAVRQLEMITEGDAGNQFLNSAVLGQFNPGLQWHEIDIANKFAEEPLMLARPKRRPAALQEVNCLAEAIYFEARGEEREGRIAVAETILNRVALKRYPNTICGVIQQGTGQKNRCQFSYNCDGEAEVITEFGAYSEIRRLAISLLKGERPQITDGATHFHTADVKPFWASVYEKTAVIGSHLFYRGYQ